MPAPAIPGHLADLVAQLSLEQKVRLLTGADFWALHDEPLVGLRRVVTSDGPAGVRGELWDERDPSLNIPSPTAIAASWDPALVEELGVLLADEARRKGVSVVLAPTVNLHRSPYGGRHFECFAEDPLLTGVIGSALVRGLQSRGVAGTVKHFVANDSETDRLTLDARVDERTLREVYLPPFEETVRAGAWAVMAAYNSVNGETMTESPLLRQVLRDEWGFDGVVMTDWYAGRSTVPAAAAALDLMMPGPTGPWRDALVAAVKDGRVAEAAVDEKVGRILLLAERVGRLGDRAPIGRPTASTPRQDRLLRRAAASGFVLVRNAPVGAAPLLPLGPAVRTVAVIGPNASEARFLGGGSALVFPPHTVSPLAGLTAALDGEVTYCQGVRGHERVSTADPALLSTPAGDQGILVSFCATDGTVLGTDRRLGSAFNWNNAFEGVDPDRIGSIVLETTLRADTAADYRIGSSGVGRFRLELDGVREYDERVSLPEGADPVEALMRPPQQWVTRRLEVGQEVRVRLTRFVEDHAPGTDLLVSLQLAIDATVESDDEALRHAERAAAAADVAVVVVGTNEEVESEGFDRADLRLPGRQDELVRRVAAARPETVVVVNSGSPVLLPWRHEVAAVLLTWFPGQEFGGALADVLTGVVEPGGRLPTTWPDTEDACLPSTTPHDGVLVYEEGLHIGHRRFLRDGVAPAYWFGHGLGYTTWSYAAPIATPRPDGAVDVSVPVTNAGSRAGSTVVQIYLARPDSAVERPVRWLGGFVRHSARPGETALVTVRLPWRAFAHWQDGWQVEPGEYDVLVGESADEIVSVTPVPVGGG